MASGIFYPIQSDHDGGLDNYGWSNTREYLYFSDNHNSACHVYFNAVTIPRDAVILSAHLKVKIYTGGGGGNYADCQCQNETDAIATVPLSTADYAAMAKTGSTQINLSSLPVAGTWYETEDFKSIIQEVVNNANWWEGYDLLLYMVAWNTTWAKRFYSFDSTFIPELHVEWVLNVNGEIVADVPSLESDLRGGGYLDFIVPSLKAQLHVPPFIVAEMPSFNSALYGEQDVIYGNIATNVPTLEANITEYPYGSIETELPALTAALRYLNIGLVASEIPSLESGITATQSAQVEADLPMLTTSMLGGARNEVALPVLTIEMKGIVGRVGSINVDVPSLALEMKGKVGYLGDIDVDLPMLVAACHGNIGRLADVAATVPVLEFDLEGWAEPGESEIRATMPSLEAIAFLKSNNRFDSCPGWKYG